MTLLLQGAGLQIAVSIAPDPGIALRADAVSYWTMNEASGATRVDLSSSGYSLTDTNSDIGSAAGKIGNASVFNNDTTQALLSTSPILNQVTTGFTVAFWFKLVSPASADDVTLILQNETLDNIEIEFENHQVEGVNTIGVFVIGGGLSKELHTCTMGQWNYFICWYDNDDQQVHALLNNSASSLFGRSGTSTPRESVGGLMLSPLYSDSIGEFLIDEFLILKRKPTQAERDYLWNSGAGRALFPAP